MIVIEETSHFHRVPDRMEPSNNPTPENVLIYAVDICMHFMMLTKTLWPQRQTSTTPSSERVCRFLV